MCTRRYCWLGLGGTVAQLLRSAIRALPVHISEFYIALSATMVVSIGLTAGLGPVRQAAQLNPVEGLRAE